MLLVIFLLSVFPLFIIASGNSIEGYYWKEYSSKIPEDAVPAGEDPSGRDTYIGQTYLHNSGIYVLQILPNTTPLKVSASGIKDPSPIIKILCSKQVYKFFWMPTNAKNFHIDVTGKHPVIGGYSNIDVLHIGRITYQGGVKVGPIAAYNLENAILSFVSGMQEKKATSYEVLLFGDFNANVTSVCVSAY